MELTGEKKKAMYDYTCDLCQQTLHKGEYYDSSSGWTATSRNYCGESERKYWTFRIHLYDCVTPEECQKGNHNFVYRKQQGEPDDIFSDYLEEGTFCTNCYIKQPQI